MYPEHAYHYQGLYISCILVVATSALALQFVTTGISAPLSGVSGGNFLINLGFQWHLAPQVSWMTNDLGSSVLAVTVTMEIFV